MVDKIKANFYRAFEDRYRGSRELIKLRLRAYLPFVEPLCSFYDDAKAVDLGCGRGEWLELLQASGFDAQGVDLDDAQLAACRELGLNVHTYDAVSFLKKLPGSSQVVVSGFHIAEHIPFPDLRVLVQEALRVLKPGGLLILETPNPENIVTGTANFFLDPTHLRPIPPQLLSFLPEYYGFEKVKILRLQESAELSSGKALTLLDVLNGVSPDYAVVAQKTAEAEILAATNPAFEAEHGLTLESLAIRYDQQAESRAQQAEAMAQQAESRAQQAEAMAQQLVREYCNKATLFIVRITWFFRKGWKPRLPDVVAAYRYFLGREPENGLVVLGCMQVKTIGELIDSLKSSEEFRVRTNLNASSRSRANPFFSIIKRFFSYPPTLLLSFVKNRPARQKGLALNFKALIKKIVRPSVRCGAAFLSARPGLRLRCVALIRRFGLYDSLRSFYFSCSGQQDLRNSPSVMGQSAVSNLKVDQLTPRARQIYVDLKAAIERRQKENG